MGTVGAARRLLSGIAVAILTSFLPLAGVVLLAVPVPLPPQDASVSQVRQKLDTSRPCGIRGRAASAGMPLPGVSVTASRDGQIVVATSTDLAGAYRLRLAPGDYIVSAELAAFSRFERPVVVSTDACEGTLDVELVLGSRAQAAAGAADVSGPIVTAPRSLRQPGPLPAGETPPAAQRFSQLPLMQSSAAGAAESTSATIDDADPATRLLPPGFSTDAATAVVAVTGDSVDVNRGQLRDRLEALERGEFAPGGAEPSEGFLGRFGGAGPGFGGVAAAAGELTAQARIGGPGGGLPPDDGPPGGGRGGVFLSRGRVNALQGSVNYTFGGSALDASPYSIRASSPIEPDYTRQQFGATVGGPLRILGAYDGSRTTFFFNYGGGRSRNLVDQYATVPTGAMRAGDFSSLPLGPIDPSTGLPFPSGRIPQKRFDPAASALLEYIPAANLPGSELNYRRTAAAPSTSDGINLRVTHNFSGTSGPRGGGPEGRGGAFGRGRAQIGTAVVLNTQVQYRRNESDVVNVFPTLGGTNSGSTFSVPVTLNILRGRTVHNIQATATRTTSSTRNGFAGVFDVAAAAGISGVATDSSEWGMPSLSFSSLTGVRDVSPAERIDRRLQLAYTIMRPFRSHTLRIGGDVRLDRSDGRSNADARGTFVFTGLYSAGGTSVRSPGLDFADFLLALPQQATIQYAEDMRLRGSAFSLFAQDDWRFRGNLTFNIGARYELVRPFTEADGRMVNLDVAPGFTAAAPVDSRGSGIYSGSFPESLINADYNNLAPRIGVAWRATPRTVARGGYGMSFNNGSYAAIARQLVAQPPFAVTSTSIGSLADPLALSEPFANIDESTTTNNFGINKNYQLGVVHTWNLDIDRTVGRGWQLGLGYTGTRGTHLDVLRAPNRDPDGLRIEGVQPFLWQTSEGRSMLHAGTVRLRKQQAGGIGGTVSYTFAKSMDDASSIGGGGLVVAQDDRNLEAEWGLSSFDRRHQLTANLSIELPFGANRRWLAQGGVLAALLSDWSISTSITAQSGTPFTARLVAATSDVARGTNGTLRADYTGAPVTLDEPALLRFFNAAAFAVPRSGTFGSAARNTIIGPSEQQVDAAITRDLRLSNTQAVSIQLRATNLFNTVRFGAIDTVVNSPTFGQVVSARPMRSVQLGVRFRF